MSYADAARMHVDRPAPEQLDALDEQHVRRLQRRLREFINGTILVRARGGVLVPLVTARLEFRS